MNVRHASILDIAQTTGQVSVEALSTQLGVTAQTIRRDLAELAEAGKLERVHGGAVLPSGAVNIEYEERRRLNESAKTLIAARCAAEIPERSAVFLNIGTTTEAVARALLGHKGLMVFTNNLNVANILSGNPEAEVVVTGGVLRRSDGGLVGTAAASMIAQYKFDIAVIGCSALDADGDILDFDLSEVGVSQAILSRARHKWLVADQSKWQRAAPARIATLADMDLMFTDGPLPAEVTQKCADWQTRIVECSSARDQG
ncbi:DeoR/GlpR family DNA-binding transcription regulator [Pseudaestuariivita sp.]|uniref:DeoR/GlpR family DNA-binding transcription regulator n=1 Tax=Pseudaestuariivita sp. TaxID=2211669 RepID=UPI004058B193